ncbi:MAG: DUF4221 family protein [Bacteroidota bacterium]
MCKYFYFAVFLLLLSCGPKDKSLNYQYNLVKDEPLTFTLDKQSTYSPFTLQYLIHDHKEYLFCSNNYTNTIDMYSIDGGKLIRRIPINTKDRQYLDQIHGFYLENENSLWVYKRMSGAPAIEVKLENFQPVSRKSFRISNPKNGTSFMNHASMTASPSLVKDGNIYFSLLPLKVDAKDISRFSSGSSLELMYNIDEDSSILLNTTYPSVYHNRDWRGVMEFYCKTKNWNNEIVYSWQASDSLFVRDSAGSLKSYYAGSSFFDEKPEVDITNLTSEGVLKSKRESNSYSLILADTFRKVYYRFGQKGIPYFNENGIKNTPYDQSITLTVLNKDFEIIAEELLPARRYLYKDAFVGKKGLYISTQNAKNENISEDVMQFDLFTLEKK